MTDLTELARIAQEKKAHFLALRASNAPYPELDDAARSYTAAIAAWHKVKYPAKKFTKPSTAYLIRAL